MGNRDDGKRNDQEKDDHTTEYRKKVFVLLLQIAPL